MIDTPHRNDAPQLDLEAESELLPADLPARAARALATLLLVVLVSSLAFVALVPLPATVTARFELVPEGGTDPVDAPWNGRVERVEVKRGAEVRLGDVLIVLRSEELRALADERARLQTELRSASEELQTLRDVRGRDATFASERREKIARLELELGAEELLDRELELEHDTRLLAARGDARRARRELEARESHVEGLARLVAQSEALAEQGVLSESELIARRVDHQEAVADREESRRALATAESRIELEQSRRRVEIRHRRLSVTGREGDLAEAEASRRERARELESATASGRARLAALDELLAGADGSHLAVRAPYDGTVVELAMERPGVSVERGATICLLARADRELRAVIDVPERDVGWVSPGQPVRLLLDAYPFTQHGTRRARLTWVSPTATDAGVTATATLEGDVIAVGGGWQRLRAGLSGEARIDTGRRTLLAHVLQPLRQLREAVAPEGSRPPSDAPSAAGAEGGRAEK